MVAICAKIINSPMAEAMSLEREVWRRRKKYKQ